MATAGALSGRIAGEEGWRNWTALHVGPREIGFDDWVLTSHDVIAGDKERIRALLYLRCAGKHNCEKYPASGP